MGSGPVSRTQLIWKVVPTVWVCLLSWHTEFIRAFFFPTLICDFLLIVFFLAESPYIVLCDKLVLTGHLCFQR